MVDRTGSRRDPLAGDGNLPARSTDQAAAAAPAEHSFWWKVWLVAKTVQARLRFIIILAACQ